MICDGKSALRTIEELWNDKGIAIHFTADGGFSLRAVQDIDPHSPIAVYPGKLIQSVRCVRLPLVPTAIARLAVYVGCARLQAMHVTGDTVVDGYPYDGRLQLG
eukprot:5681878-Prymnesium_polylepis.2